MNDRLRWVGMSAADLRAPLVGRGEEKRALEDALEEVRTTRTTRIVSVLGAAGIGKSRLVYEFLQSADDPDGGHPTRIYRGSARGTSAAYGVFEKLLRQRFGLLDGMDPEAQKGLVRAQVAAVLEDRKVGDVLYFLGQLLDLPFPESPLTRAVGDDPQQARLLRRAVLRRFLESDASASEAPTCLVFDDLDAASEDSLTLLEFLLANATGPLLILCIARKELMHRHESFATLGGDRHKVLELGTLTEPEAATVMEALLAPCGETPEALVDAACSVAGGNPSLLERMVRVFLDTGVLQVLDPRTIDPVWRVHEDKLASARMPLTVEDAVEARIAALSADERRLLEKAATMGSVFWLGGLRALERMDGPAPELWISSTSAETQAASSMLAELVARDYVLLLPDSTFAGDQEFVFKHNKERERVAQYTNAADARRYHRVLADWLEHRAGTRADEEHAGMLARHRELGGLGVRAAYAFIDAGEVARRTYANQKAAEYYEKGLELLGDLDNGRRIGALHDFGDVLQTLGRTDDALARFREMKTLAYRLGLTPKGGAAHNRIGRLYRDTGKLDEAHRHLTTALALFELSGDERGVASTLDDLGKLKWIKGDYRRALEEMRRALTMRRAVGDRRSIALSLGNVGLCLQDLGDLKQALDAFEQSLQIRREIGDLLGVVSSLNALGTVAQDQHDHRRALGLFEEALATAREVGDKNRVALVLTNVGETHYRLGDTDQAIELLSQAEGLCDEMGDKLGLAEAVRGLGKAYLLRGDLSKARHYIARAVDLFTAVRSKVHLGIALRTLGEVTAAGGWGADHTAKAKDYFRRAIDIFEEIGNEIDLARAYRAYAGFLRGTLDPATHDAAQREAAELERRADEVFAKIGADQAPIDII